ncbi:MAG TPA: TonB family protein [Terriglobales bacterium]|nr:TonB family protein [Terriglobales bacterium]
MSTTEIPPGAPAPPSSLAPRPDSGDLYDAQRWESVYREMHDVPALLIQLQDDLSRSRRREALWMSVVVHLMVVILFVNSDRLADFLPKRSVIVVAPGDMLRDKELTYLEMPPDEQKLTKRSDTNNISDKDRKATSRAPQLDREEMKHILDSARPGTPGPGGPPLDQPPQPQQPPAQAMAQSTPAPQEQPQFQSPRAQSPAGQDQVAKLTAPDTGAAQPSFKIPNLSAGSQIQQAARASMANRGGYGGDGGDYGLGQGRPATGAIGPLDVLSDTMGVDFGPYLSRVLQDVRQNWYNLIPEVARAPIMKKGKVSLEFAILKDGRVAGLRYVSSSGDVSLDRAAYGGITASNPFPPLPGEFKGQYLALRFHFFYNPDRNDLQ